MDLETRLYQLEQQMLSLVKRRDGLIAQAGKIIDTANREFDELAVPLGREINELRERLKRDKKDADNRHTARTRKPVVLDGLDDEDQAHFQELLARKRGKR